MVVLLASHFTNEDIKTERLYSPCNPGSKLVRNYALNFHIILLLSKIIPKPIGDMQMKYKEKSIIRKIKLEVRLWSREDYSYVH